MKKLTILFCCLFVVGCANVNPRLSSPIQNQNGKLEEIKNNQNGVIAEIGKLRQENQLQNSQLKDMQQGIANINNYLSRNENNGIQILQGDGALIMVFSIIIFGMILYYYRNKAVDNQKTTDLLAKEIANYNSAELNDNILRAAMYAKKEHKVYNLLTKNL
jgi:predicted PurR-regulated permease PerM